MEIIKIQKMGGIKCDNPGCTYMDESVAIADYPNWINRPCPLCGANLLIEKDYKACLNILKIINKVNRIGNLLPRFIQNKLDAAEYVEGTVSFNGTGKTLVSMKKEA